MVREDIKLFFDWYGVSKDNTESFGQITITDDDGNKLGVVNLNFDYEDLFLLIFESFKKDGDIEVFYDKVM